MTFVSPTSIYTNDFFDSDFAEEELSDDLFVEYASRFQDDPIVYCLKEPLIIQKRKSDSGDDQDNYLKSSLLHKVDYDSGEILVGPRDSGRLNYEIDHDEGVVDCVLDWYLKYLDGGNYIFPDVPVAFPNFSSRALEKRKSYYLQAFFLDNGFALYEPSYGEVDVLRTRGQFVSLEPSQEGVDKLTDSNRLLFFSKDNDFLDLDKKHNCVGIQFNPFHPMSIHRVKSLVRESEHVFFGEYEMFGRVKSFRYDFLDTRYRLHSDIWIPMLALSDPGFYECFDIVGSYDFLDDIRYRLSDTCEFIHIDEFCVPKTIVEPLFVEPFSTQRVSRRCYSVIGPWEGSIDFGYSRDFYVPYVTQRIRNNGKLQSSFVDISSRVSHQVKDGFFVRRICEKCQDDFDLCSHSVSFYRFDDSIVDIYYKYRDKDKKLVVFQDIEGCSDGFSFIKFPGRVRSYPSNGTFSLTYGPRIHTWFGMRELIDSSKRGGDKIKPIHEAFLSSYYAYVPSLDVVTVRDEQETAANMRDLEIALWKMDHTSVRFSGTIDDEFRKRNDCHREDGNLKCMAKLLSYIDTIKCVGSLTCNGFIFTLFLQADQKDIDGCKKFLPGWHLVSCAAVESSKFLVSV